MADIFVSYTSSDREWAFWIGKELEALGHVPHVHEWEIGAGEDIYAWMEQRLGSADHVLCVVSDAYLKAPYSTLERNASIWKAAKDHPAFVLFVVVKHCRLPTLTDHLRRCEVFDVTEDAARIRFRDFMSARSAPVTAAFPGNVSALSNIPINIPLHFMGRDEPLGAIAAALGRYEGRVAITALHGLRGVGKTTLAAAFAERHRADYRATWWIRAQTEATMRADLVALGVRLQWVEPDAKEEPALAIVMERLRHEGEGILLIYDNATDAPGLKPYLPLGGRVRVLVTSNAPTWRGIAEPVEIRLWPTSVGADYFIARTGREAERVAAESLSGMLGGLPLAHEQAAAYCERLKVGFAEYARRFAAAPAKFLDDIKHTPVEHNDGLTVAKSFALAIEEAAKLHPAAESLIVHAALLAPEPIPLFLFSEGREKLGEPLATQLADEGLDEALASLEAFALIDRETIADERDPAIMTDTIRLHRLVREVAATQPASETREAARGRLVQALAAVYPEFIWRDPDVWPRVRRLDALALAFAASNACLASEFETEAADLMRCLGQYRDAALAAYAEARIFFERAFALKEKLLGPAHPDVATCLHDLAALLRHQGDLAGARPLNERALAIRENALGPAHPDTAISLNDLALLLQHQGDIFGARPLFERALAINEKALGPDHPETATNLINLAALLKQQGDLAGALPLCQRALDIREKVLGADHPRTAASLSELAALRHLQGDLTKAQPLYERALAISERQLGAEHPNTAASLNNLALLLQGQGNFDAARPLFERAFAIHEKILGPDHPTTAIDVNNLATLLHLQGDLKGAQPLCERALAIHEKVLGPDHPTTAIDVNNLATLLHLQGDLAGARPLFQRALAIHEKIYGPDHIATATNYSNLAKLLRDLKDYEEAEALVTKAVAIGEKALGADHSLTQRYKSNYARLLLETGRLDAARDIGKVALAVHEAQNSPAHPWTKDSARVLADAHEALGEVETAAKLRAQYLA